jgi:hypothetical protein
LLFFSTDDSSTNHALLDKPTPKTYHFFITYNLTLSNCSEYTMSQDEDMVPMVMVRRGTEFQELIRERPTFVEMTECLKTSMVTEKYFDTHFIGWFYGKDWLKLEDARDDEGRHFLHILCESPVRSDAFCACDNLS